MTMWQVSSSIKCIIIIFLLYLYFRFGIIPRRPIKLIIIIWASHQTARYIYTYKYTYLYNLYSRGNIIIIPGGGYNIYYYKATGEIKTRELVNNITHYIILYNTTQTVTPWTYVIQMRQVKQMAGMEQILSVQRLCGFRHGFLHKKKNYIYLYKSVRRYRRSFFFPFQIYIYKYIFLHQHQLSGQYVQYLKSTNRINGIDIDNLPIQRIVR